LIALEVLVEHHFQQRYRIEGIRPAAAIRLVERLAVELVDLPLDDLGMMIVGELLLDFPPSGIVLRKRKRLKPGFLSASICLQSQRPPCGLGLQSNAHLVRDPIHAKVIFLC
jgi:hypothetical protein